MQRTLNPALFTALVGQFIGDNKYATKTRSARIFLSQGAEYLR